MRQYCKKNIVFKPYSIFQQFIDGFYLFNSTDGLRNKVRKGETVSFKTILMQCSHNKNNNTIRPKDKKTQRITLSIPQTKEGKTEKHTFVKKQK